jgi:hypothetical protein
MVSAGFVVTATLEPPSRSYAEAPDRPVLLHDQRDNGSVIHEISTRWRDSGHKYASLGADDFVVPQDQTWVVTAVDVEGMYQNTDNSSKSENVAFFLDAGGVPGDRIAWYHIQGENEQRGNFRDVLPHPGLSLESGTYWVSVQANIRRMAGDQWAWQTRLVQSNSPGVWRNPGGRYRPACTGWTPTQQCFPHQRAGPDWMFALEGVIRT